MELDEFGREIPIASSSFSSANHWRSSSSSTEKASWHNHNHNQNHNQNHSSSIGSGWNRSSSMIRSNSSSIVNSTGNSHPNSNPATAFSHSSGTDTTRRRDDMYPTTTTTTTTSTNSNANLPIQYSRLGEDHSNYRNMNMNTNMNMNSNDAGTSTSHAHLHSHPTPFHSTTSTSSTTASASAMGTNPTSTTLERIKRIQRVDHDLPHRHSTTTTHNHLQRYDRSFSIYIYNTSEAREREESRGRTERNPPSDWEMQAMDRNEKGRDREHRVYPTLHSHSSRDAVVDRRTIPWNGNGQALSYHMNPTATFTFPTHRSRLKGYAHATTPSGIYVHEPMLCQSLWKKGHGDQEHARDLTDPTKQTMGEANSVDLDSKQESHGSSLLPFQEMSLITSKDKKTPSPPPLPSSSPPLPSSSPPLPSSSPSPSPPLPTDRTPYQDYVHKYCLNYVRLFFNHHLDDTWFRETYSPLQFKRMVQAGLEFSHAEADAILQEAIQYGDLFVLQARLGGGRKVPPSNTFHIANGTGSIPLNSMGGSLLPARKRKFGIHPDSAKETVPSSTAPTMSTSPAPMIPNLASDGFNTIPSTHMHSFLQKFAILKIIHVPPHVSDAQILLALNDYSYSPVTSSNTVEPINSDKNDSLSTYGAFEIISSPVLTGSVHGIAASVATDKDPWWSGSSSITIQANNTFSFSSSSGEMKSVDNASGIGSGSNKKPFLKKGFGRKDSKYLHRTCWAIFRSQDAKEKLLLNLGRANRESNRHGQQNYDSAHNPRDFAPKYLELEVDCTDPYGRYEIDADGRGGAPNIPHSNDAISMTGNGDSGLVDERQQQQHLKLPPRKAVVLVSNSTSSYQMSQPVSVLSAAISSTKRIANDKASAVAIARGLDIIRHVPPGSRIDDLLNKITYPPLISSSTESDPAGSENPSLDQQHDEDVLDVTIAYLRRVHLFSFYHGCTMAENIGSVMDLHHPAGTIHLRLKGADQILSNICSPPAPATVGHDDARIDDAVGSDMLVRLLDQSIAKAIQSINTISVKGESPFIVNESVDALASEIEELEERTKDQWINDHSVLDSDERARCTFHFCRKLFKDKSFLQKHLMKKHVEFLNAEVAKCHDSFMMSQWDEESHRPVPDVLVDCGSKFGLVPSVICGTAEHPFAVDPEPELREEEDERQREKLRLQMEESHSRDTHYNSQLLDEDQRDTKRGDTGGLSADGIAAERNGNVYAGIDVAPVDDVIGEPKVRRTFVDVDDMKDEKVTLSFENVDVSIAKKGKKKKKLL